VAPFWGKELGGLHLQHRRSIVTVITRATVRTVETLFTTKDGRTFPTLVDAAAHFGVSTKAVSSWVRKGIIPPPPTLDYGARRIAIFPPEFLAIADRALREHREGRDHQPGANSP
jgi:hypothetical protein